MSKAKSAPRRSKAWLLPKKLTPCQGGETLRLLNALAEQLSYVHGSLEYLERWGFDPRFGKYLGPRYDKELIAAQKHIDWILSVELNRQPRRR